MDPRPLNLVSAVVKELVERRLELPRNERGPELIEEDEPNLLKKDPIDEGRLENDLNSLAEDILDKAGFCRKLPVVDIERKLKSLCSGLTVLWLGRIAAVDRLF